MSDGQKGDVWAMAFFAVSFTIATHSIAWMIGFTIANDNVRREAADLGCGEFYVNDVGEHDFRWLPTTKDD